MARPLLSSVGLVLAVALFVVVACPLVRVAAGPGAYAACQAAAATGCVVTGPWWVSCYATAQSYCSYLLAAPFF